MARVVSDSMASGGRCSLPLRSMMVKVVPTPTWLSTATVPPCRVT